MEKHNRVRLPAALTQIIVPCTVYREERRVLLIVWLIVQQTHPGFLKQLVFLNPPLQERDESFMLIFDCQTINHSYLKGAFNISPLGE